MTANETSKNTLEFGDPETSKMGGTVESALSTIFGRPDSPVVTEGAPKKVPRPPSMTKIRKSRRSMPGFKFKNGRIKAAPAYKVSDVILHWESR